MSTIFYNSYDIFVNPAYNVKRSAAIPGYHAFQGYFQLFSSNITAIDRSNTFTIPIKTEILPHLQMPQMRQFDKSFEQICDERAIFLMNKAKTDNRKIAVMYSGGIDSTVILCAFFKNCNLEDVKERIVVLLSDHSIIENPNFYNDYIIKHLTCVSSYRFPYFMGNDDYILISGENADQLFGSQVVTKYIAYRSFDHLCMPLEQAEGEIIDWFKLKLSHDHKRYAEGYWRMFKNMCDAAPIAIDDVYKFWWWINFVTKWQSVYVRILPYARTRENIKLEDNYTTFFCPEEFQLWSLNNPNSLIKDSIDMVKYVAKDYILDFNGDTSYYKKPKIGSLSNIVKQKEIVMLLRNDMTYMTDFPLNSEEFNANNTFLGMMNDFS